MPLTSAKLHLCSANEEAPSCISQVNADMAYCTHCKYMYQHCKQLTKFTKQHIVQSLYIQSTADFSISICLKTIAIMCDAKLHLFAEWMTQGR